MDERKCECGHTNPVGTMLCEACGKPIDQADEQVNGSFPDMRYEGMARRSQTYKSGVIDQIWNFFSSVKIAVTFIIITLIASAVGTIFPQERYIPVPVPTEESIALFYQQTYGVLGKIYYNLGFHNLYSSWWYVSLLVLIGTSLVICSLDRVIPLYKALNKPRVNPHLSFLRGQKVFGETAIKTEALNEQTLTAAKEALRKRGYRIYQEGNSILGEKARFSRWGPYINHIGLILFLLGVLLRNVPSFYLDEFVWVREGQTVSIPNTSYYIKNVAYKTEYYSDADFPEKLDLGGKVVPKNFQTDAIVYVNDNQSLPGSPPSLKEVQRGPIVVNHPMNIGGIQLYQSGKQESQLSALNFGLIDTKAGDQPVGTVKIDLFSPAKEQKVGNDFTVKVLDYYPDFYMDENKIPATKTNSPNNPMLALEIRSDKDGTDEKLVYLSGGFITQKKDPRFDLAIQKPDLKNITGLMVRKDTMLPLIYFGCFVTMIGLVMGFYWQHRRIWVHLENGMLYVAGHTNKNWFGLKRELNDLRQKVNLDISFRETSSTRNEQATPSV
ncbi:cytochrome c biogenesis protein ResB [Brevibacillus ginsengisoli]|uniref:cytochrome c biogenesis protein ResB n=1 Tax=Brevibacillus ginsengisoli TaxID=363854 RepID=UPI003CE754E0